MMVTVVAMVTKVLPRSLTCDQLYKRLVVNLPVRVKMSL